MGLVSKKLRQSAKGQECTFRIPGVCNHSPETTVLCHAPNEERGMGNKGDDHHAAFGCCSCHEHLDMNRLPKAEAAAYWLQGIERTHRSWVKKGLMVVPVDLQRDTPPEKVCTPARKPKSSLPSGNGWGKGKRKLPSRPMRHGA